MCVCVCGGEGGSWLGTAQAKLQLVRLTNCWFCFLYICWPVLTVNYWKLAEINAHPEAHQLTQKECVPLWLVVVLRGNGGGVEENKDYDDPVKCLALHQMPHLKPAAETNTWTIIFTVHFVQLTTGNLQQKQTHAPSSLQCSSFSSPLETCSRNKHMNHHLYSAVCPAHHWKPASETNTWIAWGIKGHNPCRVRGEQADKLGERWI